VPSSLQATTSPSMIALLQGGASTALPMSGNRFVKSRPLLEKSYSVLTGLVRLDAVAVEFYLAQPGLAGGRSETQRRLGGNDER
jgi:hypothetical protein